ncbi:hypothetical protein AGABI2DRAFT_153117 [Agaricus bisporus var. bisporus H97]|uniref:hypothetical protein n=1 Tax=Agaricus bisporus var. bisporus (strain H97 / ATCC MYA-4626 / FGSC 10389) TaxID=936046 RepID=UPI00029F742C|nr:hypothetical protein AGABI2DRAFT_153117 [Agaricus bisporus var. bisporus H97]EKV43752.1 hypothetical protein AGABI2DRAFT_153117 [Agaricus bisporus var. bisporus H97]
MQTEIGQITPYADNTRVKLKTDIDGVKLIDSQRVNHTLSAGTIVFIKTHVPHDTRTSINFDPLTADAYLYKLESTVMEKFPHFELQQPLCVGNNETQKIGHVALDTEECPPKGDFGMYKKGDVSRIRRGHQYKYGLGPGAVTLKGGDLVSIQAKPTTKSGSPSVMIPRNAYYLMVQRVKYSTVTREITWRSKYAINPHNFELV